MSTKRERPPEKLHHAFRWVRRNEKLLPTDEARDLVHYTWGRTGRGGQIAGVSYAYRRRLKLPEAKRVTKERPKVRTCRKCGCTDNDCRQCIERTGEPCSWVAADLCSACT